LKVKLYRNLSEAVTETLKTIFEGNRYADKVIEKVLKQNRKWGARDRRFIAEAIYGIVRWHRYLATVSHSQGDEYWRLLGAWLVWKEVPLPPWDGFKGLDVPAIREALKKDFPLPVRESIPDWLDVLGREELPVRWEKEIKALNEEARVVLRANTLKGDRESLQQQLADEGIGTTVLSQFPEALALTRRMNVFGSASFRQGLFEVQDAGSQWIAPFLRAAPGMRVVDACAGAGGKTLHLAALMQNKGRIVAMDTEEWKLEELRKRARRAGATNIEVMAIAGAKAINRLAGTADRLLLDVPCSGLGVLRRNPDAKWKLSPAFISKVKGLQQQLLVEYATVLKPGGMMVYSTCSILPSENGLQVGQFLAAHAEYSLEEEKHCWPSEGFDGFYMALIKKK